MGIEELEISKVEEGVGTSAAAKTNSDTVTAFCSSASVVTITQKVSE